MFRNALKVPKAEISFFCSSVFLEAGYSCKKGKTKKDGVAGRRKEIQERAAEQLCMDNISTGLSMRPTICRYWIRQSLCQHPCYCFQVSEFLQNRSFLLPQFFPTFSSQSVVRTMTLIN